MKDRKDEMKKIEQQFRQGDILIERIGSVPAGVKKQKHNGKIVLALGEATGHHHCLETESDSADWWKADDGKQFFKISSAAVITHQEHGKISLPAGRYRVRRQREYSPEAIRNVVD